MLLNLVCSNYSAKLHKIEAQTHRITNKPISIDYCYIWVVVTVKPGQAFCPRIKIGFVVQNMNSFFVRTSQVQIE